MVGIKHKTTKLDGEYLAAPPTSHRIRSRGIGHRMRFHPTLKL